MTGIRRLQRNKPVSRPSRPNIDPGFDAPSLHTMYVDKPMRGHGLMQAIARVNRVFGDKPGGLVVDYLGLAHELKRALATYTGSGGTGRAALDQGEAVAAMREKYEICCGLFHGFDRSAWSDGTPAQRLGLLPAAQVIKELIGLAREMRAANARGKAMGLSEDELAFYDALGVNDSAVRVLGDETLRGIARELVETVRANVTIDWTLRENVRAHLRRLVRRVLRRHGYPPDRQESATRTVLEQAEALSAGWAV